MKQEHVDVKVFWHYFWLSVRYQIWAILGLANEIKMVTLRLVNPKLGQPPSGFILIYSGMGFA